MAAAAGQAAGELSSASLLRTSCRITRILTPITRNRPPSELLLDDSKLQVEVNGHTIERWRRICDALDDPQMAAALKIAKDNQYTLAEFLAHVKWGEHCQLRPDVQWFVRTQLLLTPIHTDGEDSLASAQCKLQRFVHLTRARHQKSLTSGIAKMNAAASPGDVWIVTGLCEDGVDTIIDHHGNVIRDAGSRSALQVTCYGTLHCPCAYQPD